MTSCLIFENETRCGASGFRRNRARRGFVIRPAPGERRRELLFSSVPPFLYFGFSSGREAVFCM